MKHYLITLVSILYFVIPGPEQTLVSQAMVFQQDSVIRVSGHVYDSATQEALGNAIITYEELPYGNSMGIIRTDPGTGFYEFLTFGDEGYRVEIKASQYETVVDHIYPIRDANEGELTRDYFLRNIPEAGEVIKLENLIFDLGKSEIKPESHEELDRLVRQMKEYPEMVIQLEGHTDFRGGRSQNLKLSQDRVDEVKKYLMNKGIKGERILTRAFGGSMPLSRELSDEAAQMNRRVEVRIIKR